MQIKDLDSLPVYMGNDQPTTCLLCGARTNFIDIDNAKQQHRCLNKSCGHEFFVDFE